jgi:hypothetical protein
MYFASICLSSGVRAWTLRADAAEPYFPVHLGGSRTLRSWCGDAVASRSVDKSAGPSQALPSSMKVSEQATNFRLAETARGGRQDLV